MMKTRCGYCFLLCCVLACLYGCTDAKLSVTGNAGNALCIQNEHKVYMINEYNLKTRYCDECIDGYCKQCKDNRCENDSENIGKVYQCTKGRWELDGEDNRIATKCSASCNKDKTECGHCKNGSITCNGDSGYFVCVDGEYSDEPKRCMTDKCAQDQCAECKSNICLGKKKVKVCLTSSWQGDYDCEDDEICVAGECVNKCTPEAVQCSESDEDGIIQGIIYTCNDNGVWNEGEPCGKGILCNIDQNGCAACANGETNEEGKTCVEGEWMVTETTCHEGEKKCEFSIEYQCIGRNWEKVAECANGCAPTNDSCLQINSVDQSCETGQQVCNCDTSGCAIYECQCNHLEKTETCPYDCDKDGRNCGETISEKECQKDQTKCDNNKEFTCEEDGKWKEGKSCGEAGCEGDKCKQEETR